jgi:hypothetical protein
MLYDAKAPLGEHEKYRETYRWRIPASVKSITLADIPVRFQPGMYV